MKTLNNTTSETVSIVIKGIKYSIEPNGISEPLDEEVAILWHNTHNFLVIEDTDVKEVTEQEEKVEEGEIKAPKNSIVEKVKKGIKKKEKK